MCRRMWNDEEVEFLEDKWGTYPIVRIAKKLDRTVNGVVTKARRLELGSFINSGDYIIYTQFLFGMGYVSGSTNIKKKFEKLNIPITYIKVDKRSYKAIKFTELWKWLYEVRRHISFAKMEEGIFGKEPDWVKEKRKIDQNSPARKRTDWTITKDEKLKFLAKQHRYTYTYASLELSKSVKSIKRRLYDLGVKDTFIGDPKVSWDTEMEETLKGYYQDGIDTYTIARKMGINECKIAGKISRMKNKGLLIDL